jgi:hypothetical protein
VPNKDLISVTTTASPERKIVRSILNIVKTKED